MSPSFYAEETFETELDAVDDIIKSRQIELQAICYRNFEAEAHKAKILKIEEDLKDIHWYPGPNGEKWPGVTSVIGLNAKFHVTDDDLKEYAAQGEIIHAQVDHFVRTGEWKQPQDINGLTAAIYIVKTGKLGLALEGWDFPAFLEKYPLEKMEPGTSVVNAEYQYGGTPDIHSCHFKNVPTIADIKRTADKAKNFKQIAAYEMARRSMGLPANEQMMIIPLNDKTEQGYSKPIVSRDIEKYFELFLYDRSEFKKVYGI